MDVSELLRVAEERFGALPEYLWESLPGAFVLRHQINKKWFAVAMEVERKKLGLSGEGKVWLMDTKCDPVLMGGYLGLPGVVPGWHMNKNHWLGVLLGGEAAPETVSELLEISFDLTRPRIKRKMSPEG